MGVKQGDREAMDKLLFFRSDGEGWTKAETIATWRRADASNLKKPWGREQVTGHSARRTGVQILARAGWARWQVQFMSRHGGKAVDGYIEEAYQDQTMNWASSSMGPEGKELAEISDLKKGLDELKDDLEKIKGTRALDAPSGIEVKLAIRDEEQDKPMFIRSTKYSGIHIVPSGARAGPAEGWKTVCSWKFAGLGRYEEVAADALGERCIRCFGRKSQAGGWPKQRHSLRLRFPPTLQMVPCARY